jgi:anaerobic selenocysteine-containing dehydrogenase
MPLLSRRQLLRAGASTAALGLGLRHLRWIAPLEAKAASTPTYLGWADVYRAQWRWDRVVRGTHSNANCVASCAWNLYVRDGVVWHEEQAAPYAASNPTVPDSKRVPLRRVGPRGSGRWKRISWDEALDEIAGTLTEVLERRGGEGVVCEFGGNFDFGPTTAGLFRFFGQIGAPITDPAAQTGDLFVGGTATRIPDAHYLQEARYRGARIVAIAPDYNQSAVHSDLWLTPRPGTDAALALAACRVVIDEGLYAADYVREQTDLPFLVRTDTGRFLREADLVEGGGQERFALWDDVRGEVVWAPGTAGSRDRTLVLPEGVRPGLEARARVRLVSGQTVPVRTVFSVLRERLARLGPEEAAEITGVAASAIRRFAREFARAKSALILSQFGSCKNYHGDLVQRSQILLASLTGNLGRPGGGWRTNAAIPLDGLGLVAMQERLDLFHLLWLAARAYLDPESVRKRFESMFVPAALMHAVHGGLAEVQTAPEQGDPALPRGAGPYLEEALAKGHFSVGPPPDGPPPEVIFSICGNVLRNSKMGDRLRKGLFAPARLVVDVNFRISETGRYADLLLPAAGWYEKIGLKYVLALVPYLTLGDRAVAPLGEAKPEWEIFSRLAQRVAARARERNVTTTRGFRGQACDLARLDDRFSDRGRFGPEAEEDVLRFILSVSGAAGGVSLEDLRQAGGAIRVPSLDPAQGSGGTFSPYSADEPIAPLRDFVDGKRPYPTLTGRQQFYVDHAWFLELGEELPTHKDPPPAGGPRRGAPHTQGSASSGRPPSVHADRRPHPLEHPRGVARPPAPAAPPAGRAGDPPEPGRGARAGDRRPRPGARLERSGELPGARDAERSDPSPAGAHLPRLGALPVPGRCQPSVPGPEPDQGDPAGRGLRPPPLGLQLLRAEPGGSRHPRRRGEGVAA